MDAIWNVVQPRPAGVTVAVLFWICMGIWYFNRRNQWLNQIRFWRVFDTWPYGDSHEQRMIQFRINEILGSLAEIFLEECGYEEAITKKYIEGSGEKMPIGDRREYRRQHRSTLRAKQAYKYARKIVNVFGYTVKKDAKSYLPVSSSLQQVTEQ